MEAISKIGDPTGLTHRSKHCDALASTSRIDFLKRALAKFAVVRGDVMGPELLDSYSKALSEFPDDADTLAVLERLAKSPRAEFEPKIPEMGNLLGMIRLRRADRKRREEQDERDAEWGRYCAQVAQERAEEEKAGGRVPTEQDERLERILSAARHEKARTA